MNTKSAFTSVLLAGAVGVCLAAQAASANVGREANLQAVRFRDLDLNQGNEAETLLRRIRRAATMVCTGNPRLNPLNFSSRDVPGCIRQASGEPLGRPPGGWGGGRHGAGALGRPPFAGQASPGAQPPTVGHVASPEKVALISRKEGAGSH
jgi:UrcA family protein